MNRNVIVTGGTKGIGAAISEYFINAGDRVCAVYSSDYAAAEALSQRLGTSSLVLVKADVTDLDAVTVLYNEIYKLFGSIDISVHSAGVELSKMLAMTTAEEWNRVIGVNLTGVFNCSKCALKKMIVKKHGRIINISSVAAELPNVGQAAYAASKAGVNALTAALAKEAAPFGITVNAVAPAYIRSEMSAPYEDKFKASVPMKRFGEPKEVASLVGYLASDDAAYITGSVYKIGGGL